MVVLAPAAGAEHSVVELVPGEVVWVSEDGSRFLFQTNVALASEDTNSGLDVYERDEGTGGTTLVSVIPDRGTGSDRFFVWASGDGSRVFFVDTQVAVYERSGGVTTLVSTLVTRSALVSEDGSRLFFVTGAQLVPGDTDRETDVYERERSGGETTLVSTGSAGGNGPFEVIPHASYRTGPSVQFSSDGSHVFFQTFESLVPEDTDTARDIYERSTGETRLVSIGPAGGSGPFDAFSLMISRDGSRAFFETSESLVGEDTDSARDVYERFGGETRLVSTGPAGGSGPTDAFIVGASEDGTRVFFETDERLVSADSDDQVDVYERVGEETILVSTGPEGGNGPADAFFSGSTPDGSHVFFRTRESLVSSDTDGVRDIYERSGGTTTLVSTGPEGGNGPFRAWFQGASADGSRVFFSTNESLVPDDENGVTDLYERAEGTTTLVSASSDGSGVPCGLGDDVSQGSDPTRPGVDVIVPTVRLSADGSHVFFQGQGICPPPVKRPSDGWRVYVARIAATDKVPPTITVATGSADRVDPGAGWYNRASSGADGVTVGASASDPSGVVSLACTDGETTAWNEAQSSGSFTLGDGTHSLACSAMDGRGNAGAGPGSTPMPVLFQIDQTAPTLTCARPSSSTLPSFLLEGAGGGVEAEVTDATSGPTQATVSAPADVSSAGRHSVSLTGWDLAGNEATTSCDYLVGYRFLGFFRPLGRAAYEAGATIPLRFALANASGVRIPDGEAAALAASCFVRITFAGGAHRCASYDAVSDTFRLSLKTSRTLVPGAYTVVARVYVGDDLVTTKDAEVMIRR